MDRSKISGRARVVVVGVTGAASWLAKVSVMSTIGGWSVVVVEFERAGMASTMRACVASRRAKGSMTKGRPRGKISPVS